ncbi:methyltransferase domain-containing protein [Candidatus Dojkabacteria bacterium]|uniref:Methyltransferase domain-containing protein n=1 Tax=Candidatus Dojkabacteria bacterium TaxID=2099670 RepID=A0A955LAZ7_9BACT|nr:methyltransferase domain-containing protein [Candidatus Dojkabacteria bacterium]
MISIIAGKKTIPSTEIKIDEHYKKVIVDLGCGDGKQTYRLAYDNPENFYIGIDANFKGLEEISRKARKKPVKGGLTNVVFVHGVAESLPQELESVADEIQINFPWGSLLEGFINLNDDIWKNIRMIAKNNAELKVITTYDDKFEQEFREERSLPELTISYFEGNFREKLLSYGVKITEVRIISEEEKNEISSPWGKKILSSRDRDVFVINAVVVK